MTIDCTQCEIGIRRDVCRGYDAHGNAVAEHERRAWLKHWGHTAAEIHTQLTRHPSHNVASVSDEQPQGTQERRPHRSAPHFRNAQIHATPIATGQTIVVPSRRHVGCGGCQKRKRFLNRVIKGAGNIVEAITTATGIKRLVDELAERKYHDETKQLLAESEIIVKSFRRHGRLCAFIESVRQFYPTLPIRVVDDSFHHTNQTNVQATRAKQLPYVVWHQLPYDVGLSAGRNYAVQQSCARHIVLCDDDYVFTRETDLGALLVPLAHDHADLCGGLMRMDGVHAVNWCGKIAIKGDTIHLSQNEPAFHTIEYNIRIQPTDVTFNLFAATREMLSSNQWDEQLKVGSEHLDFFLSAQKHGYRCCYTVDCIASHNTKRIDRRYAKQRNRDYTTFLLRKWNVQHRKTMGWTSFPNM